MTTTTECDQKASELQKYWTRALRPGDRYEDERDGFIGSECVDWRNLDGNEIKVLEEIKYQQFQVNKVDKFKTDKRCNVGVNVLADNVHINDRTCKRAVVGLENKGRIAVEWHGNAAPIIDVLHYPPEGRYGDFTVPIREPRPPRKAPIKDPETDKIISTSEHRKCRGSTLKGAACDAFVTGADNYCRHHWIQEPSDPLMYSVHSDPMYSVHSEPDHPYVESTEGVQIVKYMVDDSSASVSADMQAQIETLETPATAEQRIEVNELKQKLELDPLALLALAAEITGARITCWADVTYSQAAALIDHLADDLKFKQTLGPYGHSMAPFDEPEKVNA